MAGPGPTRDRRNVKTMSQNTADRIKEQLQNRSSDSRIDCAAARKIAEDLGVTYQEVGDVADALGIRIRNCELGCF